MRRTHDEARLAVRGDSLHCGERGLALRRNLTNAKVEVNDSNGLIHVDVLAVMQLVLAVRTDNALREHALNPCKVSFLHLVATNHA